MIIGCFVFGQISSEEQVELIRKQKKRKLLAYIKDYRLSGEAETELVKNAEFLGVVVISYLQKYNQFETVDNNLAIIRKGKKIENLFSILSQGLLKGTQEMILAVLPEFFVVAGSSYKKILDPLVEALDKEKQEVFVHKLRLRVVALQNELISLSPEKQHINSISDFRDFVDYGDTPTICKYLECHKDIVPGGLQYLQQEKFLIYVNHYICKHLEFKFTSLTFFKLFLNYNSKRLAIVQKFMKHNQLDNNQQEYLQENGEWDLIRFYVYDHKNFVFNKAKFYYAYLQSNKYLPFSSNYILSGEAEKVLFNPTFQKLLLQYAQERRFAHHDNEICFLMLSRQYPSEVETYYQKYKVVIKLDEKELFRWANKDANVIFYLGGVTERLLFEPDNTAVLLKYAEQKRFENYQNEIRFLLMIQKYPHHVEAYLKKFKEKISLKEEDQLKLFHLGGKTSIVLNETCLAVFSEFVLPQYCQHKQDTKLNESDIAYLIDFSKECPDILADFVEKRKLPTYKLEAKLFFCADEEVAKGYDRKYGFNLPELVAFSTEFGATQEEKQVMDRILIWVSRSDPEIKLDSLQIYGNTLSQFSSLKTILKGIARRNILTA